MRRGVEVLLVGFDTEYPEPLNAKRPIPDAMGVALVLAPEASHGLRAAGIEFTGAAPDRLQGELETLRTAIPAARALPLLRLSPEARASEWYSNTCRPRCCVRVEPCH